MSSNFSSLIRLLALERDYERKAFEEAMRTAVRDSSNNTSCWFPVTVGNAYYNAVNQYVMEVEYAGKFGVSQDCEFEPGKEVSFFYQEGERDPKLTVLPGICPILRYEGRNLLVAAPNSSFPTLLSRISESHVLGVRLGLDETTYQVMEEALVKVQELDSERWIHLRDTLAGKLEPSWRALTPMQFPSLNRSQNEAVNKILTAREVAVIHGPPGTGKTTTMVEAIIETTRREPQVLVCAPSNTAVDWISELLIRRGVEVLRVGNPLRISKPLWECTYERRYAAHPDYPELWSVRKLIREIYESPDRSRNKHNHLKRLQRHRDELELKIHEETFRRAEVITCTLIGSANPVLRARHFGTVFIDEASQALEAACWAAILKADRVVLAGDHQQLPPTIKCVEAARGGLEKTLMLKIVEQKPNAVTLLDTQYRMNETIMNFSSQWFYEGRLKAAPEVAHRTLAPWDAPLVWVDTSQADFSERVNASQSRLNRAEARLLLDILKDYVRQMYFDTTLIERTTIGIISPYKAQVGVLRRMAAKSRTLAPVRERLSINTVDGFQGQERDIILISMVRDNERGSIGFLKDLRRMNVAITRAKCKLIVVGNTETLSKNEFYRELVAYFQENGIVKAVARR